MEYSNYMDMFKSGANNTPETLTAVGGGGLKVRYYQGLSVFYGLSRTVRLVYD